MFSLNTTAILHCITMIFEGVSALHFLFIYFVFCADFKLLSRFAVKSKPVAHDVQTEQSCLEAERKGPHF